MNKNIRGKKRQELIGELIAGERDPVTIGEKYRLGPDDLSVWIGKAANQRALGGLCVLADIQAQVLLSRYRLVAASRLIKLATEEGPDQSKDVARRACVDLLKLNLKRAELEGLEADWEKIGGGAKHVSNEAIRGLLYGDDTNDDRGRHRKG